MKSRSIDTSPHTSPRLPVTFTSPISTSLPLACVRYHSIVIRGRDAYLTPPSPLPSLRSSLPRDFGSWILRKTTISIVLALQLVNFSSLSSLSSHFCYWCLPGSSSVYTLMHLCRSNTFRSSCHDISLISNPYNHPQRNPTRI